VCNIQPRPLLEHSIQENLDEQSIRVQYSATPPFRTLNTRKFRGTKYSCAIFSHAPF
jgi:hypothetical protein